MSDFFFQAEDGIRDPLWSRGLGDVYFRQETAAKVSLRGLVGSEMCIKVRSQTARCRGGFDILIELLRSCRVRPHACRGGLYICSYTHLTLATKCSRYAAVFTLSFKQI